MRGLGGDPERAGSLAGTVHRGWMNLKAAATRHEDGSIVAECERGEDVALKNFREALREPLPTDLQSLVERQYREIKEAHDRMRALEVARGDRKD